MHRDTAAGLSVQLLNELQCHGKKVIYSFFLQWLVNITSLIGWLNSKPDGCFLLGPFLWINWERFAAKVENVCLASWKTTVFLCVCVCFFGLKTPFTMAQLKRPILDPSVSCCLSEKIRRHWGKCTTAFTALAGPAPTSSSSSSFFFLTGSSLSSLVKLLQEHPLPVIHGAASSLFTSGVIAV